MIVEVIQFMRPNGRQVPQKTNLPDECAVGYEAMRRHHCRLTAESLMTGAVSVTIEHEEGDYDIEVIENGPKVQAALADMLLRFDGAKFEEWLKEMQS